MKWVGAVFVLAVIAVAGAAGYGYWHFQNDPGPVEDTQIVIPRGAGVLQTAFMLESAGVISDARLFAVGVRLHGTDRYLKAGEYRIPAGATMRDVMDLLHDGDTVDRWLTIPEGLSTKQIVTLVAAEEALSGEITELPSEGSLLPETYHFSLGDDRAALLKRMQREMDEALAEIWPNRAENLPISSKQEALILASIVEKETAIPAERGRVAAVFTNRLRRGMMLQSDPTIIYGLTGGEPLGRRIRQSELDRKTPYNTYHFAGLPPTPIANPGLESIKAVLNPPETKELYFVADGTGGHAFARTYREHQENVRKWRRLNRNK
ncbi:MAG: endolytic transglycosylase MltG [Alphaproteobacteria bacterium]